MYSPQIPDGCMVVEMKWADQGPVGVLHVPKSVSDIVVNTDYESIKSGETLALLIALGLGVILAGLADTDLFLSGDKTAWKESWGALVPAPTPI